MLNTIIDIHFRYDSNRLYHNYNKCAIVFLVFSTSLMRIRHLIRRLRNAGFILQQGQGRGSHRVYDHPHGQTVTIPGHDNNNAPHYLIAQVRDAIEAAGGTWED